MVSDSSARASRYPPSAPRRDSTKPPCLRLARINSRNFCGIFWRCAISAMRTGSPARREARSRTAWSAYSPLTELCIVVGWRNHVYLTRDCIHRDEMTQWEARHACVRVFGIARVNPGIRSLTVAAPIRAATVRERLRWATHSLQAEQGVVLLRQVCRPHGAGNKDMPGVAHGQAAIAFRQAHFVGESHHPRGGFLNPRLDDYFVVEARGMAVLAVRFGHRQEDAVLDFHVAVVEAEGFAEFHPAHFHPNQVIRVVDHAHLVGFGVANAQAAFGHGSHAEE